MEQSRATVIQIMRRAGFGPECLTEAKAILPDPVDIDRDGQLLAHLGVSKDSLMDAMGGSP